MNTLMTLLLTVNVAAQTPTAPAKVDGAKLFAQKCAICHSKSGTGKASMADAFKADINIMNLAGGAAVKTPDADLIKVINSGRKNMPSFKGKLQDDEIKGILAYVRSLQAKLAAPKGKK
ncbi:MAG: cytochrome c [Elusimicrobia bacterium]|nr:cytochrome c [Elusimicrobiota bacterium]